MATIMERYSFTIKIYQTEYSISLSFTDTFEFYCNLMVNAYPWIILKLLVQIHYFSLWLSPQSLLFLQNYRLNLFLSGLLIHLCVHSSGLFDQCFEYVVIKLPSLDYLSKYWSISRTTLSIQSIPKSFSYLDKSRRVADNKFETERERFKEEFLPVIEGVYKSSFALKKGNDEY